MLWIGSIAKYPADAGTTTDQDGAPMGTYVIRARWNDGGPWAMGALVRATIDGTTYEGIKTRGSRNVRLFSLPWLAE